MKIGNRTGFEVVDGTAKLRLLGHPGGEVGNLVTYQHFVICPSRLDKTRKVPFLPSLLSFPKS